MSSMLANFALKVSRILQLFVANENQVRHSNRSSWYLKVDHMTMCSEMKNRETNISAFQHIWAGHTCTTLPYSNKWWTAWNWILEPKELLWGFESRNGDECAFTVISPGQPWPWSKSWFSQLPQVLFVVLGLCSKRSLVRLDRINWVILIKPYMGRSNCWLQWSEMENDEPILFWMHLFQFYKCLFKQDFF